MLTSTVHQIIKGFSFNFQDTNFIAIDDLSLSAGGCPPTPSCDSQTEHTCPGKCINKNRECDKTVDCFDLSDELTCDWTVNCDFQTSCPSYSSTSFLPSYTWQINSAGKSEAIIFSFNIK